MWGVLALKALTITEFAGPGRLELREVDEPTAGADEAVLDVRAIGINYPDLLATRGEYQHRSELPFVPGCEVAGVIAAAPAGSDWKPGDRAAAFVWEGGYAERVAVPLAHLAPISPAADFETAAAMVVNYSTVHFALVRRARIEPGERLFVLGASGGIGTAAIQVGKALGAEVIAGVSEEGRRATAIEAGADQCIVLAAGFGQELRAAGGRGIDVVLDPVGDWFFGEAIRALAPEGRILVVGFAAGAIPELRVNRLLHKNVAAIGVGWGAFLDVDPTVAAEVGRQLNAMVESGSLRPQIGVSVGFEEIPTALEMLADREIRGKGVATLAGRA